MKQVTLTLFLTIASIFAIDAQVITYKYNAGGGCVSRKLNSTRNYERMSDQNDNGMDFISQNAEIHYSEKELTAVISGIREEESIGYELFNLAGQKTISGFCFLGINTIDISTLTSGVYVLYLNFSDKSIDYKFIKN